MFFCFYSYGDHRDLHSFPTRRSSDLGLAQTGTTLAQTLEHTFPTSIIDSMARGEVLQIVVFTFLFGTADRKSTRLNSSHTVISYAVFCLKKKKKGQT